MSETLFPTALPTTPPVRRGWLTSLFSTRRGNGDSVAVIGTAFAVAGIVYEGVNVIWHKVPFDMVSFGAMAGQLLLGVGGGTGGREWLANRASTPPPTQQ